VCFEPNPKNESIPDAPVPRSDKLIQERLSIDKTNILKPFTLMSHRNNYILLGAHNFQEWDASVYEEAYDRDDLVVDDTEVQFQLSIKTPLAVNLFDKNIDLFGAYTIRSFWQFYNTEVSSPFRETNHEPEIWLQLRSDWEIFGFHHNVSAIGLSHMSNGQGGTLSRSWNRIYAAFAFERDNLVFLLRPWIRLEEDLEDDDNPDITDYYGHGEFWVAYKYRDHLFSMMTRNNLESGFSRGAVEIGWSFPLFDYPFLKGYIQYFSGYGESLVDYNTYVNRIGIGLQLTDVL
jgi:phospholipase A1